VGTHGGVGRQPGSLAVDPDPAKAQTLRRPYIPLEVVAHHPRLGRRHAQPLEDVPVDGFLRLAHAELAFDQDHVKEAGEIVALDLAALLAFVAIGDEGHGHAALAQLAEGLDGTGKESHRLPPARGEILGDGGGQDLVRRPEPLEAVRDDLRPSAQHIDTLAPVTRAAPDQSNTSVLFGRRLVMKMFRRLETGENPDVEIGEFLTRRGFTRVPALVGSISYLPGPKGPGLSGVGRILPDPSVAAQVLPEPPAPSSSVSIVMLQKYVWNQGNGWQVTIDELGRFFERVTVPLPSDADSDAAQAWAFGRTDDAPASVAEAIRAYLALADILGRRTGELHVTLADSTDVAFAPEPITKDNLNDTVTVMRQRAERHLALLENVLPRLEDRTQQQAREVLLSRDVLLQQFDELHKPTGSSARIRCHGDYHLGQILVTEGDVVILDFEGEPGRPLHERRAKSSPLRDIAGMMRSFSYAALTSVGAVTQTRPEDARRLGPWADFWEMWISASFLRSYLLATRGTAFLPPLEDLDVVLRAYILDKALYELSYELNNRPSWVHIPLTGVLQLRPRRDT